LSDSGIELEPWVIVIGEGVDSAIGLWRIDGQEQPSIAVFSDAGLASEYAQKHYHHSWQVKQLKGRPLIQFLVESFRQGCQYAALDPSAESSRQIFVIREVLKAARQSLLGSTSTRKATE
jgi:hypothetical protein